ncbi:hypothetical protein Patl1_14274 [Pistacia atlantica]|uniref:Uncharacterized protein n=1 Tax=Pistacia atlantica TaxID=434234 RepID=A0ACC1ASD2_9ROSI|nr:hypothetical protein Patl1_14274 [Pistacia atlantica]
MANETSAIYNRVVQLYKARDEARRKYPKDQQLQKLDVINCLTNGEEDDEDAI